jgi:hypothetical protein
MISLVVERTVNASVENVRSVAGDFTRTLDPKKPFTAEVEGDKAKNNAGCIRRIASGGMVVRERLESADPPNSLSYVILSGVPVKDYHGKMEFRGSGSDTLILWSAMFSPKIPGTGWLIKSMMKRTFNKLLDGLEKLV